MWRKSQGKSVLVIGLVVLTALLVAAYYFFDPTEAAWMPRCIWKAATGTDCPGCGSQRMAHALLHGDFRSAWHANAFAICLLPVIVFMIWLEINRQRYARLYMRLHSPWIIALFAAAVIVWWVGRNIF